MKDIIVFDLECTCWESTDPRTRDDREMIELGAVRLDEKTFDVIDTFDMFAKPVRFPELSDYCTKLTTITQSDVQNASLFAQVMTDFTNWYKKGENTVFITWGWFDRNHIVKEAQCKRYWGSVVNDLQRHSVYINLKQQFALHFNCKEMGMERALNKLGFPLDGTHHRGVDDARNIAKIAKFLKTNIGF